MINSFGSNNRCLVHYIYDIDLEDMLNKKRVWPCRATNNPIKSINNKNIS